MDLSLQELKSHTYALLSAQLQKSGCTYDVCGRKLHHADWIIHHQNVDKGKILSALGNKNCL